MNRKSIGVMPSLNSVRPVEVNGGEEVVTVGGKDLESTREAEERVRVKWKKLRQEERRGKW